MIATAHSGQLNPHISERQFPPRQNVLVASYDRIETHPFAAWLSDICRLFFAGAQRGLLDILETHAIHFIIIDTTPQNLAAGIRLCSLLKSAPQSAHLPVILLVNGHDPESNIGCLRAGADACMGKPLSREHLRAQVRNLLTNRDRLKTYFSQPFLSGLEPAIGTGENLAFANRLYKFISANLHDATLNVDMLAQSMHISRPTLYRKINYLSKQTPNGLVNSIRLDKAAELLRTGEYKVFQVAERVGFPSRSNFGRAFLRQFGLTPKEYSQMIKSKELMESVT